MSGLRLLNGLIGHNVSALVSLLSEARSESRRFPNRNGGRRSTSMCRSLLAHRWRAAPARITAQGRYLTGDVLPMKLNCPRCGAGNRIGWQTRYQTFSCSSCGLLFFGLEAYTSWGSFLLDDPSKTPCPHCWQYVRLMPDFERGGWYGPPRCSSCGKKLPPRPQYSWQEREAQAEQVEREQREEQGRSPGDGP
jgi:predicted RNA-binding Zn-ribbon protein involved in translation (DUF1610 family)